MLQYVHIGAEDRRVVELRQSFQPYNAPRGTDIACRGSSGFSIGGNSGNKRKGSLEMASVFGATMAESQLFVGCCGWAEAQARYVADFQAIELQTTFYQPPASAVAKRWKCQAQPGFRFCMKACTPSR